MSPNTPPLRRLLQEARRRRVPQTTALYLVVGYGVLEAADLTLPRLGLPDWTVTLVLALLLLGLPVVVLLSWSFDLTGRGLERTGEGAPATPPTAANGAEAMGRVRWPVVVVAIALVAVAAGAWAVGSGVFEAGAPLQADLVVVPPFRVSGDAAYLEEGMVDLLAAKLTGEGGLRAAEPRAVLAAWDTSAAPEEAAEAVARGLGAGKLLLGSVLATGTTLHIAGRIHRTDDHRELARHDVQGPSDSLPALVDRFLAGLLAQVGGVDNARMPELERTPLPALRSYLEGHAALRAGRFTAASEAFGRAIQEDTTFALAGVFHAIAASFTARQTGAGMRLAWRHRDRLAPRDRVVVDAWLGPAYPDWSTRQQRAEARRLMTRRAPDRAEAWYLRGDYVYHWETATPVAERLERAERAFQEAVRLDPNFGPATIHLMEIALRQQDTALARARAEAFLDAYPEGDLATVARSVLDRLDGRPFRRPEGGFDFYEVALPLTGPTEFLPGADAADSAVAWTVDVASDAETFALGASAYYYMNRGRPGRAVTLLRDRGLATDAYLALLRVFGALYWETGEPLDSLAPAVSRLEDVAERRVETGDVVWQGAACTVAQYRAMTGAGDRALQWARVLERDAGQGTSGTDRNSRACAALVDVLVALERGAVNADAVQRLDRLHADGTASWTWLRDAATLVLARAYEQLGDVEAALDATRRRVIGIPGIRYASTQIREEGRLAAALGRTEEAARAYRLYLSLRSNPEPAAAPFVERARAELSRLVGEY